jgi:hypothetical protein
VTVRRSGTNSWMTFRRRGGKNDDGCGFSGMEG